MEFQSPLWLLLAVFVALPWVQSPKAPWLGGRPRPIHSLIRSAAILFVVFALARPTAEVVETVVHEAIVWDRSPSISDDEDREAAQWIVQRLVGAPGTEWSVVVLEGSDAAGAEAPRPLPAGLEDLLGSQQGLKTWRRVHGGLVDAIDGALRGSAGTVPQRVTVLSDGQVSHNPDGSGFVPAARALGVERQPATPLDWVSLAGVGGDLRVTALEFPSVLRQGHTARVEVLLEGGGQNVEVILESGGEELARLDGVQVDGIRTAVLDFEPKKAGFMALSARAVVTGGVDPRGGDLSLETMAPVQPAFTVAYLGDRMEGGVARLEELIGPGFDITDLSDALRAGDDPAVEVGVIAAHLDGADLLVVDDVPASLVPEALQEEILRRVQTEGLGLLAAGGASAFGPGGYHDQPLEELLPVEFVQKEEKRDPSTTLVVIIDTSGSMGGNRVQLAKEVSRLAIRRLLPHDKVGLVEFYGAKRWAVPIQPASNSIEIERALNRLDAGGGTVILPAIEEAYYGLKNVRTRYKHVLILTDGGVETGSFEPLLRRMADDGMTVSTVLIGPDAHSEFLVNIANWGQGRFYSVPNRFNLPEILLKQPASAKLPAYRPGETVALAQTASPAWWGRGAVEGAGGSPGWLSEGIPPVAGYVETRLRGGATSILETDAEGHPLLASWRHGLGRVTALTTEPVGAGTEPWKDWPHYGEFLARVLERTAADGTGPFAFRLLEEPHRVLVVAERRVPDAELIPMGEVMGPDRLESDPLKFVPVSPNRFEARWPRASRSAGVGVAASAVHRDGRPHPRPAVFLSLGPRVPERQVAARTSLQLGALAGASGGATRSLGDPPSPALSSAPDSKRVRLRELSSLFAALALLMYLLDVVYRRLSTSAV